jgi:hypothetical protein
MQKKREMKPPKTYRERLQPHPQPREPKIMNLHPPIQLSLAFLGLLSLCAWMEEQSSCVMTGLDEILEAINKSSTTQTMAKSKVITKKQLKKQQGGSSRRKETAEEQSFTVPQLIGSSSSLSL